MNIEININSIRNETLAKLTSKEIGELGLLNCGVMTYKGELKSRVKGWKTEKISDKEVHFIAEDGFVTEFIQIASEDEEAHWAMRIWHSDPKSYQKFFVPLHGCKFFR